MEKSLMNIHPQLQALLTEQGYTEIELESESTDNVTYSAYIDAEVIVKVQLHNDTIEIYDQYLDEKHTTLLTTTSYSKLTQQNKEVM